MIRMSSQKETKGNSKIIFMKFKIFAENVLVLSNFWDNDFIAIWAVYEGFYENYPSENYRLERPPRKSPLRKFQPAKNSININME